MIQTKRSFTDGSWSEGGRLFGGEFQRISKECRAQTKINGEVTVELDIKSCHPTMAFAQVGIDWYGSKTDDIYDLPSEYWHREVIKKAFNIMLNAKSRNTAKRALNNLSLNELTFDRGFFVKRSGWAGELVLFVESAYPELSNIFYGGYGGSFMRNEGDICLYVIEKCLEADIPVLTLHDSFICPIRHKEFVVDLVREAFLEVVGVSCVIK